MKARIIFGNKLLQDLVDQYEQSHQHPVNRAFHTLGIPMIVGSIPLFLLAPLIRGFWKLPFSLFTAGWILQFAGHAVEGKPPEFFKDWRFLFVGLRWWLSKIQRGLQTQHLKRGSVAPGSSSLGPQFSAQPALSYHTTTH